jgi:hypothetical protein
MPSPSNTSKSSRFSGRVLIAQRQVGSARFLLGKITRGVLSIERITAMPVEAEADRNAVSTMAAKAKPDVIAVLVPAARTSAHLPKVEAPTGSSADVAAALSLLAEAHLPGTYPSHRRGGFVLGSGEQSRAVVVGWAGIADSLGLPRIDVWIPELAVLAYAAGSSGLAALADTTTGGFAIVRSGAAAQARSVVLAPPGSATLMAKAQQQIDAVGGDEGSGTYKDEVLGTMLVLPAAMRSLSTGTEPISRAGLLSLAGRLLAEGAMAPVLEMSDRPAAVKQSLAVRVITTLGQPRVAAVCGVAAMLLIAGAPLAFAYARLSALKAASAELASGDDAVDVAQKQFDLYELMTSKRWPMARLLAEVTTTAPQGLLLESLTIEHGRRIGISGQFNEATQVGDYVDALGKAKVLEDVKNPTTESASQRFQISAAVSANAVIALGGKARPPASTTVSSGASTSAPAASSGTSSTAAAPAGNAGNNNGNRNSRTTPAATTGNRGNSNTGNRGTNTTAAPSTAAGGSGGTAPASSAPKPPPDAISDAAINALDRSGTMKEWATRRGASQRPDLTEEVKARLTEEVAKLKARLDSLNSAGGGS